MRDYVIVQLKPTDTYDSLSVYNNSLGINGGLRIHVVPLSPGSGKVYKTFHRTDTLDQFYLHRFWRITLKVVRV